MCCVAQLASYIQVLVDRIGLPVRIKGKLGSESAAGALHARVAAAISMVIHIVYVGFFVVPARGIDTASRARALRFGPKRRIRLLIVRAVAVP